MTDEDKIVMRAYLGLKYSFKSRWDVMCEIYQVRGVHVGGGTFIQELVIDGVIVIENEKLESHSFVVIDYEQRTKKEHDSLSEAEV